MRGVNPWFIGMIVVFVAAVLFVVTVMKGIAEKAGASVAVERCVQLCIEAKERGMDLSNGPCLSNDVAPGWVCDVAHWPRLPVDDDPANQCEAFGKTAFHFVEVDENCNVIRVY
ncbi:MAG: hypothetical protein GXO00_02005 [Candidatus Diapherotrites archaeon]|nr:hypothetical protein [Candidatus Diapherotrites archaeon]